MNIYDEKIKYIFGYPDYSALTEEINFLLSCSHGRLHGLYPYVEGNLIPSELLEIGMHIEYHQGAYLFNIITLGIEGRDRVLPSRIPKEMKHIKNPYRRHLRRLIDMVDEISEVITDGQYLDICNTLRSLDLSAPSRNKLVYLEDYLDLFNKYNTLVYNATVYEDEEICQICSQEEGSQESSQDGN